MNIQTGGRELSDKETSGQMLSRSAMEYLEEHSKEKYSLEALAGALFVNGNYLMRVFKRCTGMTPLACHHQIRCRKARELLADTELSISEVGEAVGFVSSSHFSHIFRETEGCTPTEYRKTHCGLWEKDRRGSADEGGSV